MLRLSVTARNWGKTAALSRAIADFLKATKGQVPLCTILPHSQIESALLVLDGFPGVEYSVEAVAAPAPALLSAQTAIKKRETDPPRKKPTIKNGIWIENEP